MGDIVPASRVLLFAGIMVPYEQGYIEDWAPFSRFGNIKGRSPLIDFSAITDYYDEEMGERIGKYYIYTDKLFDPADLPSFKIHSNELEDKFSKGGKRRVNFDVGYISLANVVLASTKNFFHRIYLKDGIYAEVTLYYRDKKFQLLPWTYRDYQREDTQEFIMQARDYLKIGSRSGGR